MSDINKKDGLGNLIQMDNYYGYSTDNNGVTTVTIGKSIKTTPTGKVSLKVYSVSSGLWLHNPTFKEHTKSVSVKPMKLFPVDISKLKK